GTGNASLLAAATGADVTGVDPAARLLEVARGRAAAEGREIAFVAGTAEALPLPDASVDVLVSRFRRIFSAAPTQAAPEAAPVTRGAGRIVLTAWVPGGAITEVARMWREALGRDSGPGFAWHDRETLESLFAPHGFAVGIEDASLVQGGASLDDYIADVLE